MLTDRFNFLLTDLTGAFIRHQETPRHPDRIAVLGHARAELEDARTAIAAERRAIAKQTAPRVPRRTEPAVDSPVDLAMLDLTHQR